ncbi:hypothetical protein [Sulfobacillus thermosulfidooxidans]|uniref:hypothetical protein n=1 Tax=Sulfobacillus thermosulfidooxidans TaxID=28034 RepID=UPI0006B4BB78|nr:hypothetical protein [Sulfobacillus thermosulfidooxidans]
MPHTHRLENFDEHLTSHMLVTADLEAGMRLLRNFLKNNDASGAYEVAEVLLDIWTERELVHAQTEEAFLFDEIPCLKIFHRDHELMATWVDEARFTLDRDGVVSARVLMRLEALSTLLHTHHEHELECLKRHYHQLATNSSVQHVLSKCDGSL